MGRLKNSSDGIERSVDGLDETVNANLWRELKFVKSQRGKPTPAWVCVGAAIEERSLHSVARRARTARRKTRANSVGMTRLEESPARTLANKRRRDAWKRVPGRSRWNDRARWKRNRGAGEIEEARLGRRPLQLLASGGATTGTRPCTRGVRASAARSKKRDASEGIPYNSRT